MDQFFLVVNRINNLMMLLILFILFIAGIWTLRSFIIPYDSSYSESENISAAPVAAASYNNNATFRLEVAQQIIATKTYYSEFTSDDDPKFGSLYNRTIRNVLFISGVKDSAAWLFPSNNQLLSVVKQFPSDFTRDYNSTKALYLEVITSDTNEDNRINENDSINIALTKSDGSQLTQVLSGLSKILKVTESGSDEMEIAYQIGTDLYQSRISLINFKVLSTQPIAKLLETSD